MCGSDCIRREWMVKEVNAVKCQQCDFGMVPSHHAPLSWSLHTLDCSIIYFKFSYKSVDIVTCVGYILL